MTPEVTRRSLLRNAMAGAAASRLATAQEHAGAEVVVYGATPGGIATAVAAARLGRTVLLCEYHDHIGGIVSNGLTNADIGKRQAVGGLFHEYTRRVVRYYEAMDAGDPEKPNVKLCRDGYWYEANAAERIFHEMIAEQQGRIRLLLRHELKRAVVEGGRIVAIELEDRTRAGSRIAVRGGVFVDATYEGDLAAMAGAPFRTGRESRREYGEPHAGRIYMKFRGTELLPGSTGEADDATQAYCFRFHVTNIPEKRIAIEKPSGFRRDDYRLVLEDCRAGRIRRFRDVIQVYAMPNGRFELNSDHVHPDTGIPRESLDLAEECWPWATASPAAREKIFQRYVSHNVGLIWLLQHDPEVPEAVRKDSLQYGWHRDEWPTNNHMPRQVYVRQGRRITGEYVLTERDADIVPELGRTRLQPSSIATIEWAFDPHGHHHYDPAHPGTREGYIFILHEPFQVPYGVLVPRRVDGLLVPVSCSCSHVAYNALRMEPVFMALGEASGVAAHLALKSKAALRAIDTAELQALLVERRAVVTFFEDLPFDDPDFAAFQWLGARGLHQGYRAEKDTPLTEGAGAERLSRILRVMGNSAALPVAAAGRPLTAGTLTRWLRDAGHAAPGALPDAQTEMKLVDFARVVYRALRG